MNTTLTTTNTTIHPSNAPTNRTDRSAARRFFGVVAAPQSYRNLAYLLLGLPFATAWCTVLVTGLSVGASMLVVALLGVPILLGMWYVTRVCANIERGTANVLLGTALDLAPMGPHGTGNLWARLRTLTADPAHRRELGFLALRIPVGIATFSAAVTLLATSIGVAYAPFYARYVSHSFGKWSGSHRLDDIASGSPLSWLLAPLGALAVVTSFHIINALARACGRLTADHLGAARSTV